jgi:hypothetical protein
MESAELRVGRIYKLGKKVSQSGLATTFSGKLLNEK